MRTRKFTLCALAAIAALATACSNDELAGNDTPQEGIVIKATAGTPEGSADTRLTHTDGISKMDIVWAANDKFTVYESASNKTDYSIENGAGQASASFTGSWNAAPTSNANLYALYPAGTATDPAAITLSLENQTGTPEGLKDFNYMTASTTYSGTGDLAFGAFSHQVAIVKLVLTFSDVETGNASNIGLKATGLSKSTVLNLTAGTCSGETADDVTTGANTLPIANNQLTAYLCVFPGSLSSAKAIATVGSDKYEAELSELPELSGLPVTAGNMYTAAVTMTKKVTRIEWAPGNLVADGKNGAKIGTATDGGLFFQFGSLVGWNGGASGDGTGTGNTTLALSIVAKPANLDETDNGWAVTGKIWQSITGTVPFTVKDSGSDDEKAGIGDPCRYYLKGTWRLPTKDEYVELFKNNGYPSAGPWKWENSSATNKTLGITFPASGFRHNDNSSLLDVGAGGAYWSASPCDASNGYSLDFTGSGVGSGSRSNRARGLPVRCVQNASN